MVAKGGGEIGQKNAIGGSLFEISDQSMDYAQNYQLERNFDLGPSDRGFLACNEKGYNARACWQKRHFWLNTSFDARSLLVFGLDECLLEQTILKVLASFL